ncbi:MAG: helix-turn-helix domain-containing protein [Mangrovibacterium sp.]
MNSRIRLILSYKGISATEFANAIGVQPSNVSHVLNGRNNPSQPFLEKILVFYPEINARWLLLGEGSMLDSSTPIQTSNQPKAAQQELFQPEEELVDNVIVEDMIYKCKSVGNMPETEPMAERNVKNNRERKIERIITFYTDQTFEEYYPKN